MHQRLILPLVLLFLSIGSVLRAAEPVLTVRFGEKTITLTEAEFAALPHTEVTVPEQGDEPERRYSGVAMRELLAKVDAPLGDKMRGGGLMVGVIIRCKDNYAVLFSLAEFDENFSNRTILLADKENGEILPPSAAPLRVITPGDKRGARSCRQVVSIELVSLAK
ncbi:molybdopterin-dependent oxidoreductase [Luteolibacter soli]|uniref:Molybdopterin-dependent oxidoreductase n=1 Tax=Luteolibacter soli TaxID=3135280 RepID=A0ABU9AX49_9BACT